MNTVYEIYKNVIPKAVLQDLHLLTKNVAADCPKNFYYAGDEKYFREMARSGAIICCFVNDVLAGYGIVHFPALHPSNKLSTLGFSGKDLLLTAELQDCGVLGAYRGQGIQSELITRRIDYAISNGCKHVYAYVHPENSYSSRNLQRNGLKVMGKVKERKIGYCDLYYREVSYI